jgi:hypothetical protein
MRTAAVIVLAAGLGACSESPERMSAAAGGGLAAEAARPDRPWGRPDLTSGLRVPAGQRFIFAGGQPLRRSFVGAAHLHRLSEEPNVGGTGLPRATA